MKAFFILTVLAATAVGDRRVVAIRKDTIVSDERNATDVTDQFGNLVGKLALQRVKDGSDLDVANDEEDGTARPRARGVLALFLDYDGCTDFLNPLLGDQNTVSPGYFQQHRVFEKYEHERAKFIAWLRTITAGYDHDKVILFVGSNRQSISIDRIIERNPGGFAPIENGGFEAIANTIGTEVSGGPWTLNKALVADLNGDRPFMQSAPPPPRAWTDARMKCTEDFLNNRLPRPQRKAAENDLKWMMVMNNMNHLKGQNAMVYYIDDKPEFLEHTANKFSQEKATNFKNWGPGYENIRFRTVKWDYMDFIMDNIDAPIRTTSVG